MILSIFSSSLKTLDTKLMKTASEKFEYNFAKNLNKYEKVIVNIYSQSMNYGKIEKNEYLQLIGLKGKTKLETYENFIKCIGKDKKCDLILFYGYDLLKVISIIYIKYKYKIKILGFIFDSHKGAISNYKMIKKTIGNLYFTISIKLLKLLDGYILFQKDAVKELNLVKPYYISKPGIDKDEISDYVYKKSTTHFTVTYMGSLMEYNGIKEMLESFKLCTDYNIRFRIFGSGELEKEVVEYSKTDKRLYYGGLVSQEAIDEEFLNTDLLLNLRNSNDYVCKFAYPSKLIEYMSKGVPILSTDLNFNHDIKECLYIVKKLDPIEINKKINIIKQDSQQNLNLKIQNSKKYISYSNNWKNICKNLVNYLNSIIIENK